MAKLLVNPRTTQAHEIELKPGENFIGRGFANDFKIEDPSVSGSHCQIVVGPTGVVIKDLGSTNGTFINGSPVREAMLQPGQTLQLGAVEMLFEGDTIPTMPAIGSVSSATVGAYAQAAPAAYAPPPPVGGLRMSTSGAPPAPAPIGVRLAGTSPSTGTTPSLRVSVATPVATPSAIPADPPLARPIPPSPPGTVATPKGKLVCKFHPKSTARWTCPKCKKLFCDLCVTQRPAAEGVAHFCRACGVEVTQLEVKIVIPQESSFMSLVPTAFAYPFKKDGTYVIVGAAIGLLMLDLMDFLKIGGMFLIFYGRNFVRLFVYGYTFAYLKSIIHTSAYGDENDPSLPDVSDRSDLAGPIAQVFMTIVISFLPTVGLVLWRAFGEADIPGWVIVASVAFSALYFPMAYLAVTMFDSVGAVNPMVVIPAITKMPLQYSIAVFFLGVVLLVKWSAVALKFIHIPVLPAFIADFASVYFMMVQCRILGLLYYTHRRELGWFSRV